MTQERMVRFGFNTHKTVGLSLKLGPLRLVCCYCWAHNLVRNLRGHREEKLLVCIFIRSTNSVA